MLHRPSTLLGCPVLTWVYRPSTLPGTAMGIGLAHAYARRATDWLYGATGRVEPERRPTAAALHGTRTPPQGEGSILPICYASAMPCPVLACVGRYATGVGVLALRGGACVLSEGAQVIIMDEATASVDMETDSAIQ
eukprot:1744941-Rhodomonas_salina.2